MQHRLHRFPRLAVCLGLVVALSACGAALASAPHTRPMTRAAPSDGYSVSIQAVFDRYGNPLLVANFSPNGALAQPTFAICRPESPCAATAATSYRELAAGPEPAGTRFIASARYRGTTYQSSVTWRGAVSALSTPTLHGRRRAGAIVIPVAALWTGGWPGDEDQLGVQACRTASHRRCVMLGGGELGCPDSSSRPRLSRRFIGWYLFAIDARLARDDVCAGTAYSSNTRLPLWPIGPTVVRSAARGRIAPS